MAPLEEVILWVFGGDGGGRLFSHSEVQLSLIESTEH